METKRMRNTVYSILLALLVWMLPGVAHAQMDPVLTGMIIEYTNKAKSQYNTQLETMAMETEGHVWLNQEVKETKNFQKQFDEYLSSFRNIISYAPRPTASTTRSTTSARIWVGCPHRLAMHPPMPLLWHSTTSATTSM